MFRAFQTAFKLIFAVKRENLVFSRTNFLQGNLLKVRFATIVASLFRFYFSCSSVIWRFVKSQRLLLRFIDHNRNLMLNNIASPTSLLLRLWFCVCGNLGSWDITFFAQLLTQNLFEVPGLNPNKNLNKFGIIFS